MADAEVKGDHDTRDGVREFLLPDVEAHVGEVTRFDFLEDRSVDFAFASNIFEHLTQAELATVLEQSRSKLKSGGTLNILRPQRRAHRAFSFRSISNSMLISAPI